MWPLEPSFRTVEWGFALRRASWGTGLFAESARLVLQFGFETLGVVRLEARAAVDRSCTWLIHMQNDDGHWSNSEFPALTALPVWGLVLAGHIKSESVRKGTEYILTCVQKDGSIWRQPSETRKGGGLSNYNTALCMVALHAADRTRFSRVVMGARNFLTRAQHTSRDKFQGGMR